jgi:putative restriction endonuclease
MDMYIGLTDYDWYSRLRSQGYDEVNFWRPGTQPFQVLPQNGLFLFKLKKPYYAIVGGGFFVSYSLLPIDMVWTAFGLKNGTENETEFIERIQKYKQKNHMSMDLPNIGCIVLTEPFFFNESDWIRPASDWNSSIVAGKKYDMAIGEGKRIYADVQDRLQRQTAQTFGERRYTESLTKHRIGQGGFQVIVTNAYQRRCAISNEKTLLVLEAAHIKSFANEGPNEVNNGLLLRSDIHTLFDRGYLTVAKGYHIEVSKRLYEDFGNGRIYYQFHGNRLATLPKDVKLFPNYDYLEWHNNNVYLG